MIMMSEVTKAYGAIVALNNLSLEIGRGEIFGLLGPNGAGKTTTIKILTTLSRPDKGRCFIDNVDILSNPAAIKSKIGVVPQNNNLDRELTVHENLRFYAKLHRIADEKEKIARWLTMVDLWGRKDALVADLSGGMQRRLLLARAMLPDPSFLFLDEPSIGLDPQVRRQMWDIIREIKALGRTVVVTTHYIEEAEELCDRVAILAKGAPIALDTPTHLKESVGLYVVEFTHKDRKHGQRFFHDRNEAHAFMKEQEGTSTIRATNLENVFIKLTGERIE